MIFQKKIDRAMDWLHDKKQTSKFGSNFDAEEEEQIELEKGDLLPIILSALIVFGPILLVFIAILLFVFWSF